MGPVVLDKPVKFRDLRLNRSREIPTEAVRCDIFDRCLSFDISQPEATSCVISGVAVKNVGVDVGTKRGDSKLNSDLIIRIWPAGSVLRTFV